MSEVELFKRSYLQGQFVFIQGPKGVRKVRMAYELLSNCHVEEHEVVSITAPEFERMFMNRVSDFLIQGKRIFLVTDIHRVSHKKQTSFLKSLTHAKRLFFTGGIRVILIGSRHCPLSGKIRERFSTLSIRVKGCHRDNVDERVHWALELACRITQKRVTQISEHAADFLERASVHIQDDGLLQTLVVGVENCSQGILKLDDFFKSVTPKRSPPSDPANACN